MSEIRFKRNSKFLGRNGMFKSTGVVVEETLDNEVCIAPITTKGKVGRSQIRIPKENIQDLIWTLQTFYQP
jgi:hypothetical protein